MNKELLAVVWAVENFRYYLLGWHFNVITDHASLVWLTNFKNPEGMVARWLQRLFPFDYTITHRAGKLHLNADGLSRQCCGPCKHPNCPDCRLIEIKGKPVPEIVDPEEADGEIEVPRILRLERPASRPIMRAKQEDRQELGLQELPFARRT